jgi:hypothetical protein
VAVYNAVCCYSEETNEKHYSQLKQLNTRKVNFYMADSATLHFNRILQETAVVQKVSNAVFSRASIPKLWQFLMYIIHCLSTCFRTLTEGTALARCGLLY